MANKINVKLIMELKASGLSQNLIPNTRHISKTSISNVLNIAKEKQLFYENIKDRPDDEFYRLFYPDKFSVEEMFKAPNYEYVHNELKKVGVTLKLLHQEDKDTCFKEGTIAVGYTKFTEDYRSYTTQCKLSNHLYHKPGQAVEVDWSGSHQEDVLKSKYAFLYQGMSTDWEQIKAALYWFGKFKDSINLSDSPSQLEAKDLKELIKQIGRCIDTINVHKWIHLITRKDKE